MALADALVCCRPNSYNSLILIKLINQLITWITTHLPTPKGWMAELAMLADR